MKLELRQLAKTYAAKSGAVVALSPTELTCTSPKGTAGAKRITVTAPDKVSVVRDGFSYADSDNGFRGGLSGAKLTSHLRVVVIDNLSGSPIRGGKRGGRG